jgi:hypothetical protein
VISQTLLANVVYGASTGTYAGLTAPFYSPKFAGDGYRGDKHGVHTFAYFLSSGFVGSVVVQVSLVTDPTDSDWVTIESTRTTVTVPGAAVATTATYTGNVLWVRAAVTAFTAGTIVKIQYSN